MKEMHDTLKMLEELAALKDLLTYGPDDGAGADMLEIAHRADVLAAQIAKAQTAKGRMDMLKIDVWDCDIRGLGWWKPGEAPVYLDDSDALLASPAVYAAAVEAVESQGGALSMSGWYDASDELMAAIESARPRASTRPRG